MRSWLLRLPQKFKCPVQRLNRVGFLAPVYFVIYIEREAPWHAEQQDPLMPNRLLTEAADKGYILTSKQIKDILGIKPKGSSFTRLGFSFTKIGKDGIYSSWSIDRT